VTPAEVDALLAAHSDQLLDLDQVLANLAAAAPPSPAADPVQPPLYADLGEFVGAVIAPLYAAHLTGGGGTAWCPRWWEHAEARIRLGAAWAAWEALRPEVGLGMAKWLRDVADPQLDRLRDRDRGPFRACADQHLGPPPLPLDPVPEGFWDRCTAGT